MKSHTEMQGDGFRDCVINRWKEVIDYNILGSWFAGVAMFAKLEIADEMLFLSDLASSIYFEELYERRKSKNNPG